MGVTSVAWRFDGLDGWTNTLCATTTTRAGCGVMLLGWVVNRRLMITGRIPTGRLSFDG